MRTRVAPFLRWAGSKSKLLPRLVPYWGKGYSRYVEPFMGSASLFYATQPADAVLSDINRDLVSTFTAVRDHPRGVYGRLVRLPRGKRHYYTLRTINPDTLDSMDHAARFIYLNRFCFNGLYRTNSAGGFNVPFAHSKTGDLPTWEEFFAAAQALKGVSLVCGDFGGVVKKYVRPGDFVYLDPPYAVENRRIFRQYGPQTFGHADLCRLGSTLRLIDQRGAKFVLSYAASPEARQHFDLWPSTKVFTQRNISGFVKHRRTAAELIVSNISLR